MKLKMSVAQNSLPALGALAAVSLPAVAAYKVATMIRKLKEPMSTFDETRGALLKEVGELVEGKEGEYKINDLDRWNTEMAALLEADVDLAVSPIKVSELGSATVEPRVLVSLDWAFEE